MGWSFKNIGTNISDSAKGAAAWWDGVPKEKSDQDFLKNTAFKGQAGFSGNTFTEAAAEKAVENFFLKRFADTPKDKLPKSFSEEEKQAFVKEMLGTSYDKASASAKAYLFDKVDEVLDDCYEEAWYKGAGRWVKDTAAPAVVSGANTVISLTPVGWAQEAVGWGAGALLEKAPGAKNIPLLGSALKVTADNGLMLADKRESATKAINGFGEFVVNNPKRAGALVAQGVTNAGTSTVGFIVDTVVFVGYDVIGKKGIGNAWIGLQNLGSDKDSKKEYLNTGKWLVTSEWMNEKTQFAGRIQPINADGTENKNANYERTLLYGPQAIAEIGVIVIASAATGGVAGAAYATARSGGALTARTVGTLAQVKRVEAVADATQTLSKVTKAEKALSEAKTARDAVVAQNTVTASQMTTATTQAGAQGTAATTSTTVQAGAQGAAATTQSAEHIAKTAIEQTAKEVTHTAQTTSQATGQVSTSTVQASAQGTTSATGTVQTTTAATAQTGAQGTATTTTAANATNPAVAKANAAVSNAADKLAKTEAKVYTPKFSNEMKAIEKSGVTTQEVVQGSARKLELAKAELEAAQAAGKGEKVIQKLTDKVTALETKITTDAANAVRVGAQVAETNGVMATQQLTGAQNILETSKIWAHKGARLTDPFRDGVIGKTLNGVGAGASLGIGYMTDQANAAKEVAGAEETKQSLLKASGVDKETLQKQGEAQDALLEQYRSGQTSAPVRTTSPSESSETVPAVPENLSPSFNEEGARGAESTTNGGQANNFNNRAAPEIVIQIDPAFIDAIRQQKLSAPAPSQGRNAP